MSPGWRQLTALRVINFTPLWWLARDSNWGWCLVTCCSLAIAPRLYIIFVCGEMDNTFSDVFSWRGIEWSLRVNDTALSQRPEFELVTLSFVVTVLSNAIRKARRRKAKVFFFAPRASYNTRIQDLLQAIMQQCFHKMKRQDCMYSLEKD